MPSPAKSTICDRTQSSAACCGPSPVSQAAPDLQEQLGCARSCPYRQTRILTPIWESSDASGTLARPARASGAADGEVDVGGVAGSFLRSLVGADDGARARSARPLLLMAAG